MKRLRAKVEVLNPAAPKVRAPFYIIRFRTGILNRFRFRPTAVHLPGSHRLP
jgi:hypothetical protein